MQPRKRWHGINWGWGKVAPCAQILSITLALEDATSRHLFEALPPRPISFVADVARIVERRKGRSQHERRAAHRASRRAMLLCREEAAAAELVVAAQRRAAGRAQRTKTDWAFVGVVAVLHRGAGGL